ncbi:DUF6934 family protein [Pedobacter gandavensis]|uniref:DUF6934 family protein n=1 Tax=Pedobacter gandavensis TaxID=2679963 RepID=UPI002930C8A2|nr:hypothetical protein [Pedobacter gandavensis]
MQVTINFDDIYETESIEDGLTKVTFDAPQKDGSIMKLLVVLSKHSDPNLPNVFNMGFGPPDGAGGFKDNVRLWHQDLNKVFSTILFISLRFLNKYPGIAVGIDGSDDLRARFYHRAFKHNREYLKDYFMPMGVDWYVRIFRNGNYDQNPDGSYIDKPKPEPFNYNRENRDLYRYYVFLLNRNINL